MTSVTPFPWARRPGNRLTALITAAALLTAGGPASAQPPAKGPPVIRDAEIEQLLREYTQPLLQAAGLAKQNIQVVIINDRAFNAFVADGRRIFINAGTLMDANTPNEVIGVLAHETGHIAGGHLSRLREEVGKATTQSIVALLLGAGALVAASRSGSGSMGQAGMAALQGPQAMIQNQLLAYVRTQEDAADRAGVKFLAATGQSAKGMHDSFKRLADQLLYQTRYIDPYMQSHPMPAERVRALQELARSSPNWDKKDAPALQQRHDLMRAKLYGFIDRPDAVLRRFQASDNSLPARYARAIASYRFANSTGALGQIDALIQANPQNPYFHELKGQALLEAGKPAEAVAPLRRAVQLAPNPSLIQIMLAQALIASNAHGEEAVTLLETALRREPESPEAYAQLAMAYGRKGDLAHADLSSAQAAFMRGELQTARQLAARAKTRFPVGSPGWVKADDIATYRAPGQAGQRN
ncbi:MAG: M48 family metalloprotease [Xanthobacteraceae bacterium]|jgi:predicted Zn-dependent protease